MAIAGSWALLAGLVMACWGMAMLIPAGVRLGELAGQWLMSWRV